MRKWALSAAIVVALVLASYGWAWLDSYRVTTRYLGQAEAAVAAGDIVGALKGKEMQDPRSGAAVFAGGYQQVLDLWSAPGAWPKPQAYFTARSAVSDILQHRLTPADGMEMFKTFFGRDNGLLPEVLLRTGALLEEQGDLTGAQEIYQTTVEAFPVRPEIVKQAQERLDALKAKAR